MKKFLIKLLLFAALVFICFFMIDRVGKNGSQPSDYMSAIIDKHLRVASIPGPKILVGGGSNVAFGIDSKMIEDSLGMPVVNMGLHAGLGLDFILKDLAYTIKENDVVLLSIEYFFSREGDYRLKMNTSNYFPPARNFYEKSYMLELSNYVEKKRGIFKSVFSRVSHADTSAGTADVYSREAFNERGDVVRHLDKPGLVALNDRTVLNYAYWSGIDELNEFYETAKRKNVCVYFFFSNYPSSQYAVNKLAIDRLETDVRKNLKIEVLNTPKDFQYPDSCFFDTIYHLNKEGRRLRTAKMIALIKNNAAAMACIRSRKGTSKSPAGTM